MGYDTTPSLDRTQKRRRGAAFRRAYTVDVAAASIDTANAAMSMTRNTITTVSGKPSEVSDAATGASHSTSPRRAEVCVQASCCCPSGVADFLDV